MVLYVWYYGTRYYVVLYGIIRYYMVLYGIIWYYTVDAACLQHMCGLCSYVPIKSLMLYVNQLCS